MPVKILFADDSAVDRLILKSMLSDYDIVTAGDGVQGGVVEVVLEHGRDLVRALHARVQPARSTDVDQLEGPRAAAERVRDRQRGPHLADPGHQDRKVGDEVPGLLFESDDDERVRRIHGADEFHGAHASLQPTSPPAQRPDEEAFLFISCSPHPGPLR